MQKQLAAAHKKIAELEKSSNAAGAKLQTEASGGETKAPEPSEAYALFGQASRNHSKAMAALKKARASLEKEEAAMAAQVAKHAEAATRVGELEVEVAKLKAEADRASAAYVPAAASPESCLGAARPELLSVPGVKEAFDLIRAAEAAADEAKAHAAKAGATADSMETDKQEPANGPEASFMPTEEELARLESEAETGPALSTKEQLKRVAELLIDNQAKRVRAASPQGS